MALLVFSPGLRSKRSEDPELQQKLRGKNWKRKTARTDKEKSFIYVKETGEEIHL